MLKSRSDLVQFPYLMDIDCILDTPTDFTFPVTRSFTIAFHVSSIFTSLSRSKIPDLSVGNQLSPARNALQSIERKNQC